MRPPDAGFADPRQAALYDFFDDDRSDLDTYATLVEELGGVRVVDIGCGTGTFAVLLASRGIQVTAVDPAAASIDVARGKPHADRVSWIVGDATRLAGRVQEVDVAVMTGNVAQVFVDDVDWSETLGAVRGVLREGGWLVVESRRPEARAWQGWTSPPTVVVLPDGRRGLASRTVTEVALPLVTFDGCVVLPG